MTFSAKKWMRWGTLCLSEEFVEKVRHISSNSERALLYQQLDSARREFPRSLAFHIQPRAENEERWRVTFWILLCSFRGNS